MRARLSSIHWLPAVAALALLPACAQSGGEGNGGGGNGGAAGHGGGGEGGSGSGGGGGASSASGAPGASCSDSAQNGKETDVDCGGSCAGCANGKKCVVGGDCMSGACLGGACATPSCSDAVKDGSESDVDCGGTCGACDDGKSCNSGVDCANGVCIGALCQAPTCKDQVINGAETGKDCGGPACPSCPDSEGCQAASDCASHLCEGGVCQGNFTWFKGFGDAGTQRVTAVTTDGQNVIVAGTFNSSIDLGGGVLTSAGGTDIFLAKFDGQGKFLWGKRFGDTQDQSAAAVAIGPNGSIVLTGAIQGVVDFGKGPLGNIDAAPDAFLAIFDAAGNNVSQKRFTSALAQEGTALASIPSGEVVLGGTFTGSVGFGCPVLIGAGGRDVFVVKFDAIGNCVWSKRFGDASDQELFSVAESPTGGVMIGGRFQGSIDLGGGPFTMAAGKHGGFAAELNAMGTHVFSTNLGNTTDEQEVQGVAMDADGNLVVAGKFTGKVNLGTGFGLTSAGLADLFLAKLNPAGAELWSKRFGDTTDQADTVKVATTPGGGVLLGGGFHGTLTFEGGQVTSFGTDDLFLAKFDSAGAYLMSVRAGDVAPQQASALAALGENGALLGGGFQGDVTAGTITAKNAGGTDAFLTRLKTP